MKNLIRAVSAFALAAALFLAGALPSLAMTMEPGPDFGAHVRQMAAVEQHPILHGGKHFGGCVSTMASGGECVMESGG